MSSTYDVSRPAENPKKEPAKAPKPVEATKAVPKAPSDAQTDGAVPVAKGLPPRLLSLDAYRGFIMLVMASEGFGFSQVAKKLPESKVWQTLGYHFSHVQWLGCAFWDLIQPSFMFMVGVAMAYSYSARASKGQPYWRMFLHAVTRSLILVLLGVFMRSGGATNWTFMDVVSQIGLGYTFLFLLWNRPRWVQAVAAAAILIVYWGVFAAYRLPEPDFDFASVGVGEKWNHLEGFRQHWDKNTNVAAAFDRWFLNLPMFHSNGQKEFRYEGSGYPTLNFIPSLATMIFGLMTGEMLRGNRGKWQKLGLMAGFGAAALAVGWLIDFAGICPIVKVIWTPSWAIFSAGWVLLLLSAFYLVIDCVGFWRWSFPLLVVGMNSIAIYIMSKYIDGWIHGRLIAHLGVDQETKHNIFDRLALYFSDDMLYKPVIEHSLVLFVLWLICFWMYRQKIFIRI